MRRLSRSVTLVCAVFFLALGLALSLAAYRIFTTTMFERYQKQMTSLLDYVEAHIDVEDMAVCARTYEESEAYWVFQDFCDDLADHYGDLHFLYILQVLDPEDPVPIRSVSAANTAEERADPDSLLHLGDGEEGWYDVETARRLLEIQEGEEDVFFIDPSEWGVDYTLARPLVSAAGDHFGVLCVDVSMDEVNRVVYRNIYVLIGVILFCAVLFICLLLLWLRANVTRPLRLLEKSVSDYAAESTGKRDPDELIFYPPHIRTGNEVQSLSQAVTKLSQDMRDYVKGLLAAEKENLGLQAHVSEIRTIAYRDALTKVNNLAAYEKKAEELDWDIRNNIAEFAIVMLDLNKLKAVNDKYGHEHGNDYLVGACGLLCHVFSHSPVYRIGGDEFIAVLQGEDYENRERLFKSLRQQLAESAANEDVEPWHRYSAAVGMAAYAPGDDAKAVFDRADQEMYREKQGMNDGRKS
jgi:diguanylate cyclase (GGDEF)-like protein